MPLLKLESTNAFVVRDFDNDVPAFGIVRSAPKVLQGGAKELARSQSYQCAVFNMRCQGASAAVNAAPDEREAAIAAFVEELLPVVSSGGLMLDPGKGVDPRLLDSLFDSDPRDPALRRTVNGLSNRDHLVGLGAAACADAARSLDGATVAIENFEVSGPAIATAVTERGARVTALSTSVGTAVHADGFDPAALNEAFASHGAAMVNEFTDEPLPTWQVLGADVDVLFAGSKMGVISHQNAAQIKAPLVVPSAAIPYTTKGALMLESQGTTVLPDIVTTAGGLFASLPPAGNDQDQIEASVLELLPSLTKQVINQDEIAVLEACHQAESFLKTWRDELPFGRPFAP